MNGQQRDPEITYQDPQAYIAWLRSRGMMPADIYPLVTQRFGTPKTPQERLEAEQKAKTKGALFQTAGNVGGLVVANQAMQGFPALSGLFSGGGAPAAPTPVAQPTLLGGANALEATTGSTLSSIGSVALPVAAAAATISNAWETGMKDIVRGRGDRADWTNQALNMTLPGAVANMGLRFMGKRSLGAMMKSGKSAPQTLRDDFRGDLKEAGVADKEYNVTLADGSKFNIGLDGKTKYKNVGENIDGKTTRNAWDVDFSNPLAKFASDKIDPMIRNIYGADDPKRKFFPAQYTGMLVNAVTSNAKSEKDVLANIETVLGKSKFAKEAGVAIKPPPPPRPNKGEVVRVSPGMYMNDKGQIKPASTIRSALEMNYKSSSNKGSKRK